MSQSQTSKDSQKLQIKDLDCQELVDERELESIVGGIVTGFAGSCTYLGLMVKGSTTQIPNPLP